MKVPRIRKISRAFGSRIQRDRSKKIILGVANVWSDLKGLNDFLRLSKSIDNNTVIILIGLTQKQIKQLPSNIIGIQRTSDQHQLAEYYSMADVFICSSIAESFGLVIAESIACGTPAIVYNTSAMPELIQEGIGYVVERGNINAVFDKIKAVFAKGKESYSKSCREFALNNFDEKSSYEKYHQLYTSLLENKK
jgi:glycosyltransferase involved in cell wall biosynthesis